MKNKIQETLKIVKLRKILQKYIHMERDACIDLENKLMLPKGKESGGKN